MAKQQVGEERRQATRARRILSIQFRLIKPKSKERDNDWHLSTTHDMSIMGLSFLSEIPYKIDDVLELHVVMSGVLDIFKGSGRVVRVEKKNTGVCYLVAISFSQKETAADKL